MSAEREAESKQQGAGRLGRADLVESGALVGVSMAATLLGLSQGRISQLVASGALPPADRLLAEGGRMKPLWEVGTLLEWERTR